jgi:adiponectin receptor
MVHETTSSRRGSIPGDFGSISRSAEEVLVEKLDNFLNSIESRLDNFERFFKSNAISTKDFLSQIAQGNNQLSSTSSSQNFATLETTGSSYSNASSTSQEVRKRRSSSVSTIKDISANHLNQIYQRLIAIKGSVLKTSITNLEFLYNALHSHYNSLYDDDLTFNKESLQERIITTIQYFDEKFTLIDDLLKPHKQQHINQLRYYNFNNALSQAKNSHLHYYQLPLSWRENNYIIYGYRFSLSHLSTVKSVFQFFHNETMNIWTHFIGFLIVMYICLVHFPSTTVFQQNSVKDNISIYVFLAAAIKCLLGSCIWHTYSGFANFPVRARCACVDYTGITVLITCSVVAAEYASLYHHAVLLKVWISFSVICGATGFIFNWSPYFDKPECRSLRIGFFVGLAFLGITTTVVMAWNEGAMRSAKFFLPLFYKSFVWYAVGVVFYGGLFPERWRSDVVVDTENETKHGKNYSVNEVLMDKVGHDGEEEIEEILSESHKNCNECHDHLDEDKLMEELIAKHFKEPVKTAHRNKLSSLWWVDYFMNSHNVWHICVVLGIVGHYFGILEMFENIDR